MDAAPGAVVADLGLPLRREAIEELAVVRENCVMILLDPVHGVAERHLAVTMVVSVALAVGGDVRELWFISWLVRVEASNQTFAEAFTRVQQAFKGDGARCRAIVKEDSDGAAFVELYEVRARGIDRGVGSFSPVGFSVAGTIVG